MQRLIAALLFTVTTSASALTTVPFDAYCVDYKHIADMIAEHEEKPILTGVSVRMVRGQEVPIPMVIYSSRRTENTFSIVEKVNDDTFCVVSLGYNLTPYTK